jgi:hypothetical protein
MSAISPAPESLNQLRLAIVRDGCKVGTIFIARAGPVTKPKQMIFCVPVGLTGLNMSFGPLLSRSGKTHA